MCAIESNSLHFVAHWRLGSGRGLKGRGRGLNKVTITVLPFVPQSAKRSHPLRLVSISYNFPMPGHGRGRSSTNLVLLTFNPEHFLHRRLGEPRRWSQNGHTSEATQHS